MIVDTVENAPDLITELRHQANYWQSRHADAVKREAAAKEEIRQLKEIVRQQAAELQELKKQNETFQVELALLRKQVFGQKSEQRKNLPNEFDGPSRTPGPSSEARRNRGKQPGAKGYGRQHRVNLPTEEINHELPKEEQYCSDCGKPFEPFPGAEESDEIDWEVKLVRRIHQRKRYRCACNCNAVPGIITAPSPPKLVPKGMFSTGFWARLVTEKYLLQRPLHRIRQSLAMEGLPVSAGTLTGGLKRIGKLIQPLNTLILERSRGANHWHMDETRWLVFEEIEKKTGHRWWLWVVITADTCAYLLDPSRSSEVPKNHLGENPEGIINADRYSAYKAMENLFDNLRIAFCWAHVRRDFIRARDGYKKLYPWGETWVKRIDALFAQNAKRLEGLSKPELFAIEDKALRDQVDSLKAILDAELNLDDLHLQQKKTLASLRNHWDGLTIFVDCPEIAMDNNEAERRLRNPVVGRKNYYGSGSIWSGALSAMLFTIFQTLLMNQINPQKYLLAYFAACAQNGGNPPENICDFLPWNLTAAQKEIWRYPECHSP
jgi:transposase|tara:strand:- start:940 stop:2586 length:1647 start_codon:yes stop_codon:yes gene_type:complete